MGNTRDEGQGCNHLMDELTGIYNRQGFYESTERLLKQYPDISFCLIYWNIRKFKVVNDLFGREAGDKVLIYLAHTLKEEFGHETATYGRFERDNFICCVPEEVINNGKWVRLGDISFDAEGSEYHFYSCCGLYKIIDRELTIANMIDRARVAMETVKNNYLKPYAWYEESMWGSMVEEQKMNSSFRKAIAENQFKVYYQPLCRASDGAITGAEALVRWEKPGEGLVSPGKFIPIFEKNGLISVLDRYVWGEVCRMQRKRLDQELEVVPISINVSRIEFYNPHLCDDIYNIVKKYDLPTELIKIEITESAYADDSTLVQEAVKKLHEYGFVVLMDDFGSGYSSLNTLKDLPIDVLKIDMKFMDSFDQNQKAAVILEAIIRMAKWMKLRTVAEGVETKKEWEYLRSMECDVVQGYYFYRPMPEKDFEELLNMKKAKYVDTDKDIPELDDVILDAFSHGNAKESMIFYSMLGGMGIFEMTEDNLEIIQVNRGYYEVIYGTESAVYEFSKNINKQVKEPERTILLEKCRVAKETDEMQHAQIYYQREDGKYIWLNTKVRYIGSRGNRSLFYFAIDNIDDIKKAEQDKYLLDYSAALVKVFDKVYRMDYDTGRVEVLHSSEDTMKVKEKYYFRNFFEKFHNSIEWDENRNVASIINNRELLDEELKKSKSGSFAVHYKVKNSELKIKEVSAMFFKVELQDGREEYLCCIKKERKKE